MCTVSVQSVPLAQAYSISANLASIPIFCILMRYNLQDGIPASHEEPKPKFQVARVCKSFREGFCLRFWRLVTVVSSIARLGWRVPSRAMTLGAQTCCPGMGIKRFWASAIANLAPFFLAIAFYGGKGFQTAAACRRRISLLGLECPTPGLQLSLVSSPRKSSLWCGCA